MVEIKGNIVDVHGRRIFAGLVTVVDGRISSIQEIAEEVDGFIMPGFVDAHIHIESSMLVPYEFSRIAVQHGTVATISDPHEIANVLGVAGVEYMLENAKEASLKFHFGAPSCVPATSFETAGAEINSSDIERLMARDDIFYLSEMMNYPGVLSDDPEVMEKIAIAKRLGKPVDGHAPGLRGNAAKKYIEAGISTDHECFTLEEAKEKLKHGMKILIREGSAAKNYEALHPLIAKHPEMLMLCSDDKQPDDLMEGHINELVTRSLALGNDLYDVLRMACVNPVLHYNMDVGLLQEGNKADFIIVEDLKDFKVRKTYIDGIPVYEEGLVKKENRIHATPNQFNIGPVDAEDFHHHSDEKQTNVIRAIDGELITEKELFNLSIHNGLIISDQERDILKIAVINRYAKAPIATAFITGFGLKNGALASSVAHDSHNVVVVGCSDELLAKAANLVISGKGGLAAVSEHEEHIIALPVAGLMSDRPCAEIAQQYLKIDAFAKSIGSELTSPFMTLSFMALLVIPKIKLSDKGLFDAESFQFITNTAI